MDYLNRAIRRYPYYTELVNLVDVKQELAQVRGEAAIAHLEAGNELLAQGAKRHARAAYHQFGISNRFVAGTASLRKLENAQLAGTEFVALEFANRGRFFRDFNTDRVFDELGNNFRNSRYRFIRVVDPKEVDVDLDHIVQIEMDDAHIGRVDFSKMYLN